MVLFFGVFDREVNADFIISELDFEIVFFVDNEGDLNAYFGGSLVPRIGELGSKEFLLSDVFFSHLDDSAFAEGLLSGLLDFLQKGSAHQRLYDYI